MKNYFSFSTFGLFLEKAGKFAKIQHFLKKNVEESESEEW